MGFEGYHGNQTRDKWSEFLIELIAFGLSLVIFGIQVAAWVGMGAVAWRLSNVGKHVV